MYVCLFVCSMGAELMDPPPPTQTQNPPPQTETARTFNGAGITGTESRREGSSIRSKARESWLYPIGARVRLTKVPSPPCGLWCFWGVGVVVGLVVRGGGKGERGSVHLVCSFDTDQILEKKMTRRLTARPPPGRAGPPPPPATSPKQTTHTITNNTTPKDWTSCPTHRAPTSTRQGRSSPSSHITSAWEKPLRIPRASRHWVVCVMCVCV